MRKKNIIILLLLIAILVGIYFTVNYLNLNKKEVVDDQLRFMEEYVSLNNKKTEEDSKYLSIDVRGDNNVKYIGAKKVIQKLQKGTSVIYFGFPECPWCRNLVPVLADVNSNYQTTLYYFNALSIRDIKHKDSDGEIVVDKEGTDEYYKIIELLSDYLDSYDGLEDDSIKRLYFPTVVFVKDGKIIGVHTGTVDSQKDPNKKLTKKQKEELTSQLEELYDEVTKTICLKDEKC